MNPEAPIALVTGANRGLGLETSGRLLEEGWSVILTGRAAAEVARAQAGLAKSGRTRAVALDITDQSAIARLAEDLRRDELSLDLLVNNAAVVLNGFDLSVVEGTLAVNVFATLHVTDALAPLIRDGGSVVMVSSRSGQLDAYSPDLRRRFLAENLTREQLFGLLDEFAEDVASGRHTERGWPSSAYKVSKAALNALNRILAGELRPRRIRVNAVCPGWVRTRMGGPAASRSVEEGAESILRTALLPEDGPSGGFFRDGRPIPW
jgi:NAD(P)-dependent dehydrogenase (short-subunit alcohol dehydrogenase family)